MGTTRILLPLSASVSLPLFVASHWVLCRPFPTLPCICLCLCLFLFLSLSVLPAGCLFGSSLLLPLPLLLLLLSLVCVLSVLHLIFIRFYFPFLLRSFFFSFFAVHIFLSFGTREKRAKYRTENATVRWKRKIKNVIAIKIAWQTHCKMLHV